MQLASFAKSIHHATLRTKIPNQEEQYMSVTSIPTQSKNPITATIRPIGDKVVSKVVLLVAKITPLCKRIWTPIATILAFVKTPLGAAITILGVGVASIAASQRPTRTIHKIALFIFGVACIATCGFIFASVVPLRR